MATEPWNSIFEAFLEAYFDAGFFVALDIGCAEESHDINSNRMFFRDSASIVTVGSYIDNFDRLVEYCSV